MPLTTSALAPERTLLLLKASSTSVTLPVESSATTADACEEISESLTITPRPTTVPTLCNAMTEPADTTVDSVIRTLMPVTVGHCVRRSKDPAVVTVEFTILNEYADVLMPATLNKSCVPIVVIFELITVMDKLVMELAPNDNCWRCVMLSSVNCIPASAPVLILSHLQAAPTSTNPLAYSDTF